MRIIHYGNVYYEYGGTDITVRTILREMVRRGHECYAIVFGDGNKKTTDESGIIHINLSSNERYDFDLFNKYFDDETVVYTALMPHPKLWNYLINKNIPYVHEYNMPYQQVRDFDTKLKRYVFNSNWTRGWYPQIDGEVIYPLIDFSQYKIDCSDDKTAIGMINPCLVKGVEIVRRMAYEFPKERFITCGGWGHNTEGGRLRLIARENVKHYDNSPCASDFYNKMQILLVPTQTGKDLWTSHPETFGRVALEGMYHGCAVISSFKDGLPEAMGDGGFMVSEYTNYYAWVQAIKNVQKNIGYYVEKAHERVKRYINEYPNYVNQWERTFEGVLDAKYI